MSKKKAIMKEIMSKKIEEELEEVNQLAANNKIDWDVFNANLDQKIKMH